MRPIARARFIALWARFITWWLGFTCGLHYQIQYESPLPAKAGVFLVKHQSAWDTIVLQALLPPHAWVLKRELFWIPIFGWGLALSRPIAIDRSTGRRALDQVIKQGKQKLAEGRWVLVFPEGTRIAPGKHGEYKVGGSLLAEKAGVDAVPIAHNAGTYWPKRGFLKKPGVITAVIGSAISTKNKKARQVNAEAERWIRATMKRLEK
jgi:1-acyl-sn-glycerol-3-phosphate acyltransferase